MSIHAATPHEFPPGHARDLGAVIRGHRNACRPRMTQSRLGAAVGYSAAWVSRVESNEIAPQRETLIRIASVLGIAIEDLGFTDAFMDDSATRVTAGQVPGDQEGNEVRRRNFLAGTVGVGAVLITGTAQATGMRTLETSLFEPLSSKPLPLSQLARALSIARTDFSEARYQKLGARLPLLIAAAEATCDSLSGSQRELAYAMVARSYVLASELAVKAHSDTAWVTADRALSAARSSGHAAPIAEAARMLAITMRRSGHGRTAVDLLTRTALSLSAERAASARQTLAVRISLLLTAAYSAAQAGDRTDALALADEAEQSAALLGVDPVTGLFTVAASPQQCTLYRVGILNSLGSPEEAARYASRLNPAAFPTAERRARCYTDMARMWHLLNDHERTYAALRLIERHAPEEVRRSSVQALTADLVYAPVSIPGLKEFAARTGVTPH